MVTRARRTLPETPFPSRLRPLWGWKSLRKLAGGFKSAASFAREFGAVRLGDCLLCRAVIILLRARYGFPAYNISTAYPCREYKSVTAALAESLSPAVVVDVGCGLGEVLAHIKAERRYGFDINPAALRAARFWHSRKIVFAEGSFFDAASIAAPVKEPEISLMIMNNWVHGCDFEKFKNGILEIAALKPVRYIIFDFFRAGYNPGSQNYAYSPDELSSLGALVSVVPAGQGRDLYLLRLT